MSNLGIAALPKTVSLLRNGDFLLGVVDDFQTFDWDGYRTFYSLCSINPLGFADESPILLIKFHPEGEPEASICCVAKGSNPISLYELRRDRVKNTVSASAEPFWSGKGEVIP